MPLQEERLREIVHELAGKPGHEKVRLRVHRLLEDGLGIPAGDISFEQRMPEVRGRADALLGLTVLEFKSDLRSELRDAEEELTRYIGDRERKSGQHYVGVATDGSEFRSYRVRGGKLELLQAYRVNRDAPAELIKWLDSAVSISLSLDPQPPLVRRELGKESLAFAVARSRLEELYESVKAHPNVVVKRQLWAKLLKTVYGSDIDDDDLFFQHTYLTVVAKTMATQVLGAEVPPASDLLSGKPFLEAAIFGAVESDFFGWVLDAPKGAEVVERIARQVSRFRFSRVEHDVLKVLYESLIDPSTRKDLGEYYTPDWMAEWVCGAVVKKPLRDRVLDPACGSGTFLFHAVRRFLGAADEGHMSNADALEQCVAHVLGIDIHPVAVIIARVTYLLALGEVRLRADRRAVQVPVYLGDSMQWNTEAILTSRTVRIDVPAGPALHLPWAVTQDPSTFDEVVATMLELSERSAPPEAMHGWLDRRAVGDSTDRAVLVETYQAIRALREAGRNHIWGYVARNLARPIWLTADSQRADVVVGNPPWLAYQHMFPEMQAKFHEESLRLGTWVGGRGNVAHQDLSAYFYARCVELYLKTGGTIAFVMPYAVLSREHFRKFLTGKFVDERRKSKAQLQASVRFREAWGFDERVQPLFRVPSSVLIGEQGEPGPLPATVTEFFGTLPRRDAPNAEAHRRLRSEIRPWPTHRQHGGWYEQRFRQGAIVVPRMMFVVDLEQSGRFGHDNAAPVVKSRRSSQEKPPWRDLPALRGKVEQESLRPLLLGESVAPYRVLSALTAVIPWDSELGNLMDSSLARGRGLVHLSRWLDEVEELWKVHGKRKTSMVARLDYFGQLRAQFPIPQLRVVYAKAGTFSAAAAVRMPGAIIDHKLYWTEVEDDLEARYLLGLLNSEALRRRIAHLQSRGQWGARDFDKALVGTLPQFRRNDGLHLALTNLAERAEAVALSVPIPTARPFALARTQIRAALRRDGVATEIDSAVETRSSATEISRTLSDTHTCSRLGNGHLLLDRCNVGTQRTKFVRRRLDFALGQTHVLIRSRTGD